VTIQVGEGGKNIQRAARNFWTAVYMKDIPIRAVQKKLFQIQDETDGVESILNSGHCDE
jgi:hypothetical protein